MVRTQSIRDEVIRCVRAQPFHPFALLMENGDQIVVEHPENIAFDPTAKGGTPGRDFFYAIHDDMRTYSTFSAVTSIVMVDRGEAA